MAVRACEDKMNNIKEFDRFGSEACQKQANCNVCFMRNDCEYHLDTYNFYSGDVTDMVLDEPDEWYRLG
jgi:hypothetical protein